MLRKLSFFCFLILIMNNDCVIIDEVSIYKKTFVYGKVGGKMSGKIILIMIFILSLIVVNAEEKENLFKDISKEHWAYYSIENLVYKGIIEPTSEYFNGEREITKNELAFYLSKVLNKLDEEKVSKDDLLIIENLVYEFSEDLNKFSFNVDAYNQHIENINNKIKENNIDNAKKIKEINERILKLEKTTLNSEKKVFLRNENNQEGRNIESVNNFKIKIITEVKKNNQEKEKYKENYEVEFGVKEKKYEAKLKIKNETESVPILKIKAETEIIKDTKMIFHTKDYKNDKKSYFGNLDYTNYDSEERKYNSVGLELNNDKFQLMLETAEELIVVSRIETKYINTFLEKNLNESNNNFELVLKYPLFKEKVIISSGYTNQEEGGNKNKYINLEAKYKNKKSEYSLGYEKKEDEEPLYNDIYGKISYQVKSSVIRYKTEVLDTPMKLFANHYFILENSLENEFGKLKIFLGINKIEIGKEKVSKDLIKENEEEEITDFSNEEYTEMFTKIEYLINKKYGIQTSYLVKNKNEEKQIINFIKLYYKLQEEINIYIKYLKTDYEDYNDMEENINKTDYNMNFDEEKNIENNAKDGEFSIGIEFRF